MTFGLGHGGVMGGEHNDESTNDRLRESTRRRDHALRNHLGAILGFAALLREEEDLTEQQREDIDQIYASGQKMLKLLSGDPGSNGAEGGEPAS